MTKTLKFIIQKEGKYYVSQCLNVDISSFGNTVQEAIDNLNEALDLYFEDKEALFTITPIQETLLQLYVSQVFLLMIFLIKQENTNPAY